MMLLHRTMTLACSYALDNSGFFLFLSNSGTLPRGHRLFQDLLDSCGVAPKNLRNSHRIFSQSSGI